MSRRDRDNKKKRFSRKGVSTDTLKARSEQSGFGSSPSLFSNDVTLYKVSDGDNFIRIIPPVYSDDPTTHYAIDIYVHYGMGASKRDAYLCPEKSNKGACPICEAQRKARDIGDVDRAKELNAGKRCAVYVIDKDNEEEGVKLWSMPWTIDKELAKLAVDKRTGEVFWLDDPEEGYGVTFTKEGKGLTTKYTAIQLSRRPDGIDDVHLDWAEKYPLPEQLLYHTEKELTEALCGSPDVEEPTVTKPETWDAVKAMTEDELLDLCEAEGIEVKTDDVEQLKEDVADALNLD